MIKDTRRKKESFKKRRKGGRKRQIGERPSKDVGREETERGTETKVSRKVILKV
jgi:hypothetical protein